MQTLRDMLARFLPGLLCVLTTLLAACGPSYECTSDADCAPGHCVESFCVAPSDCPGGEQHGCFNDSECASGACGMGCCLATCQAPADCGPGATCLEKLCLPVAQVGCSTNDDCVTSEGLPACDPVARACVQCTTNEDCPAPLRCTGARTCQLPFGFCKADADCAGEAFYRVCDTSDSRCVACLSDDQCPAPGDRCGTDRHCHGTAVGCLRDTECAVVAPGLRCDSGKRLCVACLEDADCSADGLMRCSQGSCVPGVSNCSDDTVCGAGLVCRSELSLCVVCRSAADCPDGMACLSDGSCAPAGGCASSADCGGRDKVCETVVRQCRECVADGDCPGGTCRGQQCVPTVNGCLRDADCPQRSAATVCDPATRTCVGCTRDDQCEARKGPLFVCDAAAQACLEGPCRTHEACREAKGGAAPFCAEGACVQCVSADQCAAGETCRENRCRPVRCQAHADCADLAGTTLCRASDGMCVGCLDDGDCSEWNQSLGNADCRQPAKCDLKPGRCLQGTDLPDATSCEDGNLCTLSGACRKGICIGGDFKRCPAQAQCTVPGECIPATGECTAPPGDEGMPCEDGDACTQGERCMQGLCGGATAQCARGLVISEVRTENPVFGIKAPFVGLFNADDKERSLGGLQLVHGRTRSVLVKFPDVRVPPQTGYLVRFTLYDLFSGKNSALVALRYADWSPASDSESFDLQSEIGLCRVDDPTCAEPLDAVGLFSRATLKEGTPASSFVQMHGDGKSVQRRVLPGSGRLQDTNNNAGDFTYAPYRLQSMHNGPSHALMLSQKVLFFGTFIGQPVARELLLTNVGTATLTFPKVPMLTGADSREFTYSPLPAGARLAPGASMTITVTLGRCGSGGSCSSPIYGLRKQGLLTFFTDEAGGRDYPVALVGRVDR